MLSLPDKGSTTHAHSSSLDKNPGVTLHILFPSQKAEFGGGERGELTKPGQGDPLWRWLLPLCQRCPAPSALRTENLPAKHTFPSKK